MQIKAERYKPRLDKEGIEADLLGRNYAETLFSDIEGQKHGGHGKEVIGTCPFCRKEKKFYYSLRNPKWQCFSCHEKGNWYSYLEKTKGMDFKTALQELARAAGVEIPEYDQKAYERKQKRLSVLEEACRYFKETLQTPAGNAVKDYLLSKRGYSEQDIEAMDLGAYVSRAELSKRLEEKGFSLEDLQDVDGLLYDKDKDGKLYGTTSLQDFSLAIPIEGLTGQTIGIAFRCIGDRKDKYRYSGGEGVQKSGLTGLSRSIHSKKKILVEGVLDAHYVSLKAEEAGLKEPIIALGTSRISDEQIEALKKTKTEEVILALDSDEAGQKGTAETIDKLRRQAPKIKLYVAPLGEYDPTADKVDPDSLVKTKGIEVFVEACKNAEDWSRWYAERTVVEVSEVEDVNSDRGRDILLRKLSETYSGIEDRQERLHFLEPLEAVRIDKQDLEDKAEPVRLARAQERIIERKKQLQDKLSQIRLEEPGSEAFSIRELEDTLSGGLADIQAIQAVPPVPYLYADLLEDLRSTEDGLRTGFTDLDKRLSIPQGALTIVAGRPGQGKTTLQLNLLVNMLKEYPSKEFFFFSYEESKRSLAVKLLMILAGVLVDPSKADSNYQEYIRFLKVRDRNEPDIEPDIKKAVELFDEWTGSGRLWLSDSRLDSEQLCRQIAYLDKRGSTGAVGAVFVDYLQKIPVASATSARYLDIKEVSGRLLETAVRLDIPILLGAQLGRPDKNSKPDNKAVRLDNLRESGDIEQDANLVLGLHCQAIEEAQDQDTEREDKTAEVNMDLHVLKNRAGVSGVKTTVSFNRPRLTIKDKDKAETNLF